MSTFSRGTEFTNVAVDVVLADARCAQSAAMHQEEATEFDNHIADNRDGSALE